MNKTVARQSVTHFVAVLAPEPETLLDDRTYYGPMLQGLRDGLQEAGFFMRIVQCRHEYQQEHLLSSAELYAGVVFLGATAALEPFVCRVTAVAPGPKVLLDHRVEGLAAHSVRDDAETGMRLLAEHLLGLGHRRLAYVEMSDARANPWKRRGINRALSAAGLEELGKNSLAGCRDSFADVSAALDWLLSRTPRPSAVICSDDTRALLLLQAAAEKGLRVPGDLSIAGFGDQAVRTGRSRALTSVRVDPAMMGRRAAELIAAGPAEPADVLVAPELMPRATTAAPER
ncbi:MAG TPA: LacI family DNA-binding transcriptional regulator [Planctomycetota bacterium]|nr:LacI family DNA-binding transcriptional regulator [Planctomycetota bacterium]